MNHDRWSHIPPLSRLTESMDWRHVQMIHTVLSIERPESVVEIGCANGFSTSAIIEAIEQGFIKTATLIDHEIRDSLKQITDGVSGISVLKMLSQEYKKSADCWIIDGDHNGGAEADYHNAIEGGAKIIIAHDTNPKWINGELWGAIKVGERIRKESKFFFEDFEDRPPGFTIRGLTVGFYGEFAVSTVQALMGLTK